MLLHAHASLGFFLVGRDVSVFAVLYMGGVVDDNENFQSLSVDAGRNWFFFIAAAVPGSFVAAAAPGFFVAAFALGCEGGLVDDNDNRRVFAVDAGHGWFFLITGAESGSFEVQDGSIV